MADEIENRHYTKEEEEVEKPDLKRQSHDDSDLPDSTSGVGRRYPTPPPGWILVLTPKLKTTERLSPAISMSGTTLASAVTINPKKAVTINPKKEIEERNRPLTEIEERNRPLTEDEFDALFLFIVQERDESEEITDGLLPFMKPKDYKFFGTLLKKEDEEEELSSYEQEERIIMKLLLELKNGTLHQMKTALRQLIVYAREVDAGPLFNQIFRLLMQPTLEEQEAHLLVKVISRIVYELDELVRPNVRKIIVVIRDLLMDEDNNVRAEGSEIIYNLSKAAGLATMIDAMRSDIDNIDEYVRIATTRSFVVVASALGIAALLPFMKEVCQSKKSWQARHTGLMIVHEIIINNDHAVVPHLRFLEEIIKPGLKDEVLKVRTGATLALAALDKVAAQYGHCRDIPPMPFYAVAEPDILLRGFNI